MNCLGKVSKICRKCNPVSVLLRFYPTLGFFFLTDFTVGIFRIMSEHIVVSSWLETDDSSLTSGIFCHSIFPASVTTGGSLSSRGFLRQHGWRHSKLLELRMIHRLLLFLLEMLSRVKRLPLDTWSQSILQENVFGNQFLTFDSPKNHPQRIQSDDVQRNRESVPEAGRTKTIHTSEDRLNQGTIPMPTSATKSLTASSTMPVDLPQNYMVRQQISELQFDKLPNPQSFPVWKIRFKNQVTTCYDFSLDAMLWIKEVEMVDSLEESNSSRSVAGKNCPDFEMLDAKIASALNKIIQNSQFNKKVSLEEQKAQKEDRFPSR